MYNILQHLEAAKTRHLNVEKNNIRFKTVNKMYCFKTIHTFLYYLQLRVISNVLLY